MRWLWLRPADGAGARNAALRLPEPLLPASILALGAGAWVVLVLVVGPAVLAMTLLSPLAFTTLTLIGLALLWLARGLKRHCERVRTALLARAACPGCLYDLRDARPDDDGCTCCPECGAAWDVQTPKEVETVVVRMR